MKSSINLVIKRNELEEKAKSQYSFIRLLAISLLSIVAVVAIILMILIGTSPLPRLRNAEQAELSKIAIFHPKMAKIIITNERLDTIGGILQKRSSLDAVMELVKTYIPSEMAIVNYKIEKKDITLTLESPSLNSVNALTDSMNALTSPRPIITSAILSGISYDKEKGKYSMNLEMHLL